MVKKVYELAKELGVSPKELIAKAGSVGLKVKTRMSVLQEADVEKIVKAMREDAPKKNKKSTVGKPVVDEDFLANRNKPKAVPVVDEAFFEHKEKVKEGVEEPTAEDKAAAAAFEALHSEEKPAAVSQAEAEAPKAEEAPKESAPKAEKEEKETEEKPVKKTEVSTAAKEAKKSAPEKKAAPKSEEKTADRKPDTEKKAAEKKHTAKKTEKKEPKIHLAASERIDAPRIKIVRRAEDVKKDQQESVKRGAASGERRGRRQGERKSEEGQGRRRSSENRGPRGQRNAGGQNAGPRRSRGPAPGGAAPAPSENRQDRRGARRHGGNHEEGGRGKFAKFERHSLEKKERKKYNKPKVEVEEVEEEEELPEGTFKIDVPITVAGFCEQTEVSTSKVIMTLMKLGIMANINQTIDEDTVMVLAEELGINVVVGDVEKEEIEEGIESFEDDEKDLVPRPPVITVMGHVDHGKTSLLDAIRKTNVTEREFGGITQHIGASEVKINGRKIVFLDTPGHEAFTAMRARGAQVTDIAVLVVAANDGVMPQTIESISHAKAANVPIIVAITKMDMQGANPDRVKKELADNGILVEDWGGNVICVPVSVQKNNKHEIVHTTGIEDLLEMILLQADMMELKANPDRLAMGTVIEARLDKARGPVATLLVNNGTLKAGQSLVAGTCSGRIRAMTDFRGKKIRTAGPATAVEILGLTDVPQAGDTFNAVSDDKTAREIAEHRAEKLREEVLARNSSMTLEKFFSQMKDGEVKELNLIIKADVQGSVGALISSLEKLNNDEVHVNVVHSGVGTVTESDIMLAETSSAVIIGFNVRTTSAIDAMADGAGVEIRLYTVIYDVINDVEAAMKGMLEPEVKEEKLGKAEVRSTFRVPNVGIIAGSYVTEGKVARNASIRLVRDGIVIHEGIISSLKRFKDDAKEVAQGYECGIGIENYNDLKEGDIIEAYRMVEVKAE